MINLHQPELKFAIQVTRQAALLVRQIQDELVTPALTKGDRSPVTVADFASQALVSCLLSETFPNDLLVAEEDAARLRLEEEADTLQQITAFVARFLPEADPDAVCSWIDRGRVSTGDRFWTLDPIDGTKGYLRGDQYAVALALIQNGEVQLGVLGCPNLSDAYRPDFEGGGSLVVAARNQGTWTTSLIEPGEYIRLQVSSRQDPSTARILRSFESSHTNVNQTDELAQALNVAVVPVRMDSQAKYAVLSAGKGDLLLRLLSPSKPDYREKIWDQAAGSIATEEAGGRVTDLRGNRLDFTTGRELVHNRGILASNGWLHDAALKALEVIGA